MFAKESILSASDPLSPFFVNIPAHDAKPIDQLVTYFKFWKAFIKSLIFYCKELDLTKEIDANLNFQLINSVQYPGFKNLPAKYTLLIEQLNSPASTPRSEKPSNNVKPKELMHRDLKKSSSNTSLSSMNDGNTTPPDTKRPVLFKTKSNQSFLKGHNNHKRNISMTKLGSTPPSPSDQTSFEHKKVETKKPLNDVHIPANFFPEDSLMNNMGPVLINHHFQLYQAQTKFHRELVTKVIPRLETLLKNLSNKIKEIRSTLKNDSFANPHIIKEISKTGKVLSNYISSIERYSSENPVFKHRALDAQSGLVDDDEGGVLDDPFLIKLQVDYQLKNQLLHENYMFASYVNLQNISKDLFTYVTKDLGFIVDRLGKLINQESIYSSSGTSDILTVNLLNIIKKAVPRLSTNHDWEYFIMHNPNFVNTYESTDVHPKKEARNFNSIRLPYANSIHNKCLRFGVMYKKLKILKNYNSFYYVLTCNYLHEFKIEKENGASPGDSQIKKMRKDKIGGFIGHEDIPVKSYNLNDYAIKVKDEGSSKFTLVKMSNASQKFTFKCGQQADFDNWYNDLNDLLKFGDDHLQRFAFVEEKVALREKEQAQKKQAKAQPAPEVKDKTAELRLNLGGLSVNNNNQQSLNGIFTPRIRSPSSSGGDYEKNPFEDNFVYDIPSNISSPRMSPHGASFTPPTLIATSPTGRSAVNLASGEGHEVEHENYLKLQQEVLKQQQTILSLRLQESERKKMDDRNWAYSLAAPNSNLSRVSSVDSLSSMGQPSSNIQKLINSGRSVMHNGSVPRFLLNDSDSLFAEESEVPRVLISQSDE